MAKEAADKQIQDEAADDTTVTPQEYTVSSFGADYDVRGLVNRLNEGKVFIPPFQRNFVWDQPEASRFVESLLLGLPVPGIFLAKEAEENKLLVIDGQQRLKTLQFFYNGFFNPPEGADEKRVFRLKNVQPQFEGKAYKDLSEKDRNKLDDSILHATVVKQEYPTGEDTSLYHIFERLNNGGRLLYQQEIRVALYHGALIDAVAKLNKYKTWRAIFGPVSNRLKDQELILRFLAFYFDSAKYKKPLGEFLNKFASKTRNAEPAMLKEGEEMFIKTVDEIYNAMGKLSFRVGKVINTAFFDAVMVGLSRRLKKGGDIKKADLKKAYSDLLKNEDFLAAISKATSDETNVKKRIDIATRAFSDL